MSEPDEDAVEWVQADKFVMPVIPGELQINPCTLALLHCVSFLELSGDDTVDPDWAVEAMEHVAHYLQRLAPDAVARLAADMQAISAWAASHEMPSHFVELAKHFTEYTGLQPDE